MNHTRWEPDPLVGRKGSKVSKRKLTLGQKMFLAIMALTILGIIGGIAIACKAQCCPPPRAPTIITREIPVIVEKLVVVEKELPCANHQLELGFQMLGPEPMLLAANIDGRLKLGGLNIGERWLGFDIALGLSGAAIGDQPIFGVNAKFGVSFADPGPYFDVVRLCWFPQWTKGLYYEEVGLRIPVLWTPIGQTSALIYLGGERFVHYSPSIGYLESNTLLVGGTVRLCKNAFSFAFQTELRASYQIYDCENRGLGWNIALNVFLWF